MRPLISRGVGLSSIGGGPLWRKGFLPTKENIYFRCVSGFTPTLLKGFNQWDWPITMCEREYSPGGETWFSSELAAQALIDDYVDKIQRSYHLDWLKWAIQRLHSSEYFCIQNARSQVYRYGTVLYWRRATPKEELHPKEWKRYIATTLSKGFNQ